MHVAKGWSQKELAGRSGVSKAQVSRDGRNEYRGVSVNRAQRLLGVMGVWFRMQEGLTFRLSKTPASKIASGASERPSAQTHLPEQVSAFLYTDPKLSLKAAENLAKMFAFAYEAAANETHTRRPDIQGIYVWVA